MSQYTIADDITEYWDARYRDWLATAPDWDVYNRKEQWFEERLAHLLPPVREPVGRVLDYGCGNAMFAVPLLRRYALYDGFDTSRTAVEIAGTYYSKVRPDLADRMWIDHYTGKPGEWDPILPDATYDLVMSITVLQHQPLLYRKRMIEHIKGLLRPGGLYLGLEWIGGTQAYDMPPMDESEWRAAWAPWVLTFDRPPEHPLWADDNIWTARLP